MPQIVDYESTQTVDDYTFRINLRIRSASSDSTWAIDAKTAKVQYASGHLHIQGDGAAESAMLGLPADVDLAAKPTIVGAQQGFILSVRVPKSKGVELFAASWNIAAVNNNPFEYWISHPDEDYNKLMRDVEAFIDGPGDRDLPVRSIFTDAMWKELKALMIAKGWAGVNETENFWETDLSQRRIISQFMKDTGLGDKRLASIPDRMTNTISLGDGTSANRPTVISSFGGEMSTVPSWWAAWKDFMFINTLQVETKKGVKECTPADLLVPIKKDKYPAITEAEAAVSIPLQTLCQAIFDVILVHIVSTVSPDGKWLQLKQQMLESLVSKKDSKILGILKSRHSAAHVIFLQEASANMCRKASTELSNFLLVTPASRNMTQDSALMLNKSWFVESTVKEVTASAVAHLDKGSPVTDGDLVAVTVEDVAGRRYLLASFHGDTNGLATAPVLEAMHKLATTLPDHLFWFGLDANTYEVGKPGKMYGATEFVQLFKLKGYSSCWGDEPQPKNYTTCLARTFLQAQLQKAARFAERTTNGDINPKDFILFHKEQYELQWARKDNTGKGEYIEGMPFPTLDFPSDHGLISMRATLTTG